MLVIFFMAGILYGYDLLLRWLLDAIDNLITAVFG
jgi:preprotein translocase subunit SecE